MKRTRLTPSPHGLTRHTGFSRRAQPLARESAAHRRQRARQGQAYGAAGSSDYCEVCGATGAVEHSHYYTQKRYPEHRNNPLNWEYQCRGCHALFENHKADFARHFPTRWRYILARMQQLDPVAFVAFRQKNPY